MKKIQFLTFTLLLASALLLPIIAATAQSNNGMVRLVYFLPKDRSPRPDRVRAFRQTIKDAQEFYADEMERHGFGRKTFNIETNKNGNPVVHHVYGKFNENYYYNRFTGLEVWKEFFEYADDPEHIYFFAIDLSNDMLSSGNTCGTAGVNYFPQSGDRVPNVVGPGPLAMRYANETQGEEALGGAVAIPASGSCFERIGLTLHELGHAFGLQHDFREGINNDYVMAYAHTKKRLSKCAAEWLSVSRFFNSNPKPNRSPGSIQLISKPRYSSDGISIRFKVADADGLHQAQLLGAEMTEQGTWKDDKLFDCKQLNGKTSTIEFISQTLTIEPADNIMLQIIDVNGGITWATFLTDIASVLPQPKVVKIPDKNLAAAIRTQLGLAPRETITDRAMQRLTTLEARDSQIKTLTGLEQATQLTGLYLPRNQIRNVTPLAGLTHLKYLVLNNNDIRNIQPLTGLTQLEELSIGGNQIKNKGVQLLEKLTQLRALSLFGNQISNIKPLANLTNLERVWLSDNQIRDVSPLAGLVNLETLYLSGNPITNTAPLSKLKKLKVVDIKITTPTAAVSVEIPDKNLAAALRKALGLGANTTITKQAMHRLTWLEASDRQIRDLTGLAHATELTGLDLGSNRITNFSPLAELPKLRKLYLEGNEISDLSVLPALPKLEFLDLNWNQVSDISPLAGFTSLKELWLQGNKLADTSTLFELHGGTFPADEMVRIIKKRDNRDRAYTLLTFRSLGLKIRVNPDVRIYQSVNALENARKPLEKTEPTTSESIEASVPMTDDLLETKKIPATDAMVSISPASIVSPAVGGELPINLNIVGGELVAGYRLTLQFDPTALRYVESINGDYLPTGAFFVPPVVNSGSVELAATALIGDSNRDGTLAIITFETLTVKASTLTLSDILLVDSQGNTFLPQVEAGEITEPPELKTDVTGDGVVNILDLVLVANALGTDAPDLNGDGVVNVLDLVIVANAF